MAEKLFLQWNDFQDNGKTAFGNVVQLGKGKDCAKICKVCGKEGQAMAITNHIEANHLDGVSVPCNLCEKILRSRAALRTHISRYHKNIYWYVIFQDKECPEHRNTEAQKDRSLNIYWDHHPPVLNSFAAMTIATMIFAFTKKNINITSLHSRFPFVYLSTQEYFLWIALFLIFMCLRSSKYSKNVYAVG